MTLSRWAFAASIVAVGLVSGFFGALLALEIDEPEVVIVDRAVALPTGDPLVMPSDEDMELLVADYLRLTSDAPDAEFAGNLVGELAVNVCDYAEPPAELFASFERDLDISETQFVDFYDEIAAVCPTD